MGWDKGVDHGEVSDRWVQTILQWLRMWKSAEGSEADIHRLKGGFLRPRRYFLQSLLLTYKQTNMLGTYFSNVVLLAAEKACIAFHATRRYGANKLQAPLHLRKHLLRQSLSAWSTHSQQKAVQAVQWRIAVRHRYLHLLQSSLGGWQQHIQRCEQKRQAVAGAARLYQQSLRGRAWKVSLTLLCLL